ncbi:anti-anti-sigma factor, putative [Microscilla marina ATCC 23134]|uniref:Anti-sigma factor antagonist n=1 Tax=Microscilla marina ATCC 23134 TaxID=313606 RepID=A1ZXG1_MICM2|nr:anti-anti-sigma factor, putative [Microscilla marina ATCC 23134]
MQNEKMDATLSPELKSTFVTLNAEGAKNFVIDLSKVKYVDSSGLGALLIANRLCMDAKGTMVLTGITDHVMKLIKISQLDKVLKILPTNEEAIQFIHMNEVENDVAKDGGEG